MAAMYSPYFRQQVAETGPDQTFACEEDASMTKMTLGSHPHMLGFEQLERLLERTAKSAEGYPPYNIERTADDVTVEDRQLVVRCRQSEIPDDRV